MLENNSALHFPFLDIPAHTRLRTTFYNTLARLLFMGDYPATLNSFMQPILEVLHQLMQTQNYRQENVKTAIIGVCRDLRGITSATHNRRTYGILFDLLYPDYFPAFVKAAEVWYDTPEVTTPLLKFMGEFVHNKAQRVVFDNCSPNGILLFRQTSELVCQYGSRIIEHNVSESDIYTHKYKGMGLSLHMLSRALGGNYVNFGVFELYNDKALEDALIIALQMVLSMPLSDVMAFPKVAKSYYLFLEVLFRNHISQLLAMDPQTGVFVQLLTALQEGLESVDSHLASQSASAIDHLASYHFRNGSRDTPKGAAVRGHMEQCPGVMTALLTTLFSSLIFKTDANYWSLSRPLLSIILCRES